MRSCSRWSWDGTWVLIGPRIVQIASSLVMNSSCGSENVPACERRAYILALVRLIIISTCLCVRAVGDLSGLRTLDQVGLALPPSPYIPSRLLLQFLCHCPFDFPTPEIPRIVSSLLTSHHDASQNLPSQPTSNPSIATQAISDKAITD